jgi:hypothetical protein
VAGGTSADGSVGDKPSCNTREPLRTECADVPQSRGSTSTPYSEARECGEGPVPKCARPGKCGGCPRTECARPEKSGESFVPQCAGFRKSAGSSVPQCAGLGKSGGPLVPQCASMPQSAEGPRTQCKWAPERAELQDSRRVASKFNPSGGLRPGGYSSGMRFLPLSGATSFLPMGYKKQVAPWINSGTYSTR